MSGVRHLREIELFVETVVRIEPADMRRRERDVALWIALGKLLLVQPIDRAAGDVLDRHPGLGSEPLADDVGGHVAPAATPYADDELVLGRGRDRRQQQSQRAERHGKPLHAPTSPFFLVSRSTPGGSWISRAARVDIRLAIIRSGYGTCPALRGPCTSRLACGLRNFGARVG